MLNCIILEDQILAQDILVNYIERMEGLYLSGVFTSPIKALSDVNWNDIQVAFLDIHLPELSGMDMAKKLPKHVQVVFTTAFSEFALASYDVNAIDYLLKPISFDRFQVAIEKIHLKEDEQDFIFVKSNSKLKNLLTSDIVYFTSEMDYTEIHTLHNRYVVSEPLKFWKEKLMSKGFVQCHKSYIVNLVHIREVKQNLIFLNKNLQLPIGRAFKTNFLNHLK